VLDTVNCTTGMALRLYTASWIPKAYYRKTCCDLPKTSPVQHSADVAVIAVVAVLLYIT